MNKKYNSCSAPVRKIQPGRSTVVDNEVHVSGYTKLQVGEIYQKLHQSLELVDFSQSGAEWVEVTITIKRGG